MFVIAFTALLVVHVHAEELIGEAPSPASETPTETPTETPREPAESFLPSTPQGPFSVVINGGDDSTESREVTLTLTAGDNVGFVEISDAEDFSGAVVSEFRPDTPIAMSVLKQLALVFFFVNTGFLLAGASRRGAPPATVAVIAGILIVLTTASASALSGGTMTMPWTLSDGPGEKTVFVRFYADFVAEGTSSPAVSDSIVYEPPLVQEETPTPTPTQESPVGKDASPVPTTSSAPEPISTPTPTRTATPTPTRTPTPTPIPTQTVGPTPFVFDPNFVDLFIPGSSATPMPSTCKWRVCIQQPGPGSSPSPSGSSTPTPAPSGFVYPSTTVMPTNIFAPTPWVFPATTTTPSPTAPKKYVRYLGSPDVFEQGTGIYLSYDMALQLARSNPKFWSSIQNLPFARPSTLPKPSVPTNTPPPCAPLITTMLRSGAAANAAEVRKLQTFLRDAFGATAVQTTGIFDAATESAVRSFQQRYADDILRPLGLSAPTGIVGPRTMGAINRLSCARSAGR